MKKVNFGLHTSLSGLYPKEWNVVGCRPYDKNGTKILEFHAQCQSLEPFECEECGRIDVFTEIDFQCRTVTDITAFDYPVRIVLHRRRWRCPCGSSVISTVDGIHDSFKFTLRCIDYIIYKKNFMSAENLAFELGVSKSTIKSIISTVKPPELSEEFVAPRYLGIDEIRLRDRKRKNKSGDSNINFYCVFVDLETGRLIDMVRGKDQKVVSTWLFKLKEKHRIRAISTDFDQTYRGIVHDMFPNVIHIIDKFHAMQEVWQALDQVRVKVLRKRGITVFNSPTQISIRDMLRSRKIDTSDKRWLILEDFLNANPEVRTAYNIKNEFCDIWNGWYNMPIADRLFILWEKKFSDYTTIIQDSFLRLRLRIFGNYEDILQYFDFKITNANTEQTNRFIRKIHHESGGLSFDELRYKARVRTANKTLKKFICDACASRVKIRERHIESAMTTKTECIYYNGEFWVCDNCHERHIDFSPKVHRDFWVRWSNEWALPSSRETQQIDEEILEGSQVEYDDEKIFEYLQAQTEKKDRKKAHSRPENDDQKSFLI